MAKPGRPNFGFAWFSRVSTYLIAILLLGWSAQAAASIGCEIHYNSASSQTGDAGTQLTYTFDIFDPNGGTSCPGGVNGTVTESPTDSTGGASANPTTWSGFHGDTVTVTVTLGPNSGGSVDYTVDCTDCSGSQSQVFWTAYSNSTYQLLPTTAQSFTTLTGQSVNLGVQYLVDGAGTSTLDTLWTVDDSNGQVSSPAVTPDGSGNAGNSFFSGTPGTYVVTVKGACPVIISLAAGPASAPVNGCPPQATETFTIVVEQPALTPVSPASGTATIGENSSIVLKVKYAGATVPVQGEGIEWTVTEPPGGTGTLNGGPPPVNTITAADGTTQVTLGVTTAGTYTVQACHPSDGCLGGDDKYTFTITVSPLNADLSVSKTATPSPVAPGGQLTYNITVANNGPDGATQLVLTDTLPAQLTFASIGTPPGWNCSTPAVGSGGTVTCNKSLFLGGSDVLTLVTNVLPATPVGTPITNSATVTTAANDPDGSNNSATVTTLVAASAPSLSVSKVLTGTVDNDASGSVSAGDRLDYEVTATNNGNSVLTNVVVSDDHFPATQSCATLAVSATCVLSGGYVVTAADVSAGSVTNIGSATSTQVAGPISSSVITPITTIVPVTLGVGTGDGQSAPVDTPFPQALTVVAGGAPPTSTAGSPAAAKSGLVALATPNVTINWQVVSGSATLQVPSSVTNSSGIASNNAFAGPNPGPVVIRATRADDPGVFVEFHLTVTAPTPKFSDLPGLDENQKALAEALDEICSSSSSGGYEPPSLAASSTSSESDLLARCQELLDSILTDPSGVVDALNELFADIALVQSESSLLAAQSQFDNIKARIAALRSGTNRTGFGGLTFRNSSGSLPVGAMFQSLLAQDPEPAGAPKEVGTDFSRWGFFASGSIGRGDADKGSLSPEYDFDIDGLTVGADYRKSDKLIFGGTLGYTRQGNDLAGDRGNLETKGWSVSAYGTYYQQSSWYVDGVLSWGQNSYDIERHVRYIITTPSGQTTIDNSGHGSGDGDSLTFALSVGRDFNKGGWGFGPYLRAMYTKMDFDTIEEHFDEALPGSGLALELDTRSVTSLTSTLGGKLTYAHSTDWGVLIPHLQLEWQHEFQDDPSEVEMRFLFDPAATPFTIHGDPIDTDFFRFGVGMSFVMTKGRSGFFYYERLISRERFSQNSLALGIRLEF